MSAEDMQHRFGYHPADTPERQEAHEDVRYRALNVAALWDASLPEGSEKALAITKLEEAMFWANAAIARQGSD